MLHCLKCESKLGPRGLFRVWTLRIARCQTCGAEHSSTLPRGARLFIQGIIGVTYGLTVMAGNWMGCGFLESTGAYLFGSLLGTISLVLTFALTGRLALDLVNNTDGASGNGSNQQESGELTPEVELIQGRRLQVQNGGIT